MRKTSSKIRIGVYPGTFDPITNGHTDIIKRALSIVDELVIAVAEDTAKTPVFSLEQRVAMVGEDVGQLNDRERILVKGFHGLLMDFAAGEGASVVIRGLRAVSDFEYEFQLSAMNSRLRPDIQTVFLPAAESTQFIASRLVKEVARLGGDVSPFVSAGVAKRLRDRYGNAR